MSFNWVDLLLILLVLLSAWGGWRRGFILSALDLVRWTGSFLAGLLLYQSVSRILAFMVDWADIWRQPAAFILVVIAASVLIQIAGNALLRRIPGELHKRPVNRAFGILPGAAGGLITAALVSALLFAAPFSESVNESARTSLLADRLAVFTDELETSLGSIFEGPLRQTLNRRTTVEPGSGERVDLPFKIESAPPRPDLEAEMLALVNLERAAHDLEPLEADPEMLVVARGHSADMFSRGYFSHYTPENKDPFERIREADVRFRIAGENLAFAPSVRIAHTGLMNSPGHRANILRPQFGRVGIGILDGGRRGLMVTQNFRN